MRFLTLDSCQQPAQIESPTADARAGKAQRPADSKMVWSASSFLYIYIYVLPHSVIYFFRYFCISSFISFLHSFCLSVRYLHMYVTHSFIYVFLAVLLCCFASSIMNSVRPVFCCLSFCLYCLLLSFIRSFSISSMCSFFLSFLLASVFPSFLLSFCPSVFPYSSIFLYLFPSLFLSFFPSFLPCVVSSSLLCIFAIYSFLCVLLAVLLCFFTLSIMHSARPFVCCLSFFLYCIVASCPSF